jgi:hypothetical protein
MKGDGSIFQMVFCLDFESFALFLTFRECIICKLKLQNQIR